MTDEEFTQLFMVLDQVWGGVDEGREQGYRWVLASYDSAVVVEVVAAMAREDRPWLPKAPEIAARCDRILARHANDAHIAQLFLRMKKRLGYEERLAGIAERAGGAASHHSTDQPQEEPHAELRT
jgi:hypothetical protein